jgi:UDP-glucose 4-epimerase
VNILVTGGSGFVGGHLLNSLVEHNVCCIGRTKPKNLLNGFKFFSSLGSEEKYKSAMANIDCIIHCAARAHIMNDRSLDPLAEFRKVNTYDTLNLAKQAAASGIKRFIYISSIKVNGDCTKPNEPFKESDFYIPTDPYGLSKYEAEVGLSEIALMTGMELVVIRPPLVYGPGVKANFSSLMSLVLKGIPLPFGFITSNIRSLVSVNNLVDLILTCIDHPKAANQVFLVSDDHDVSTASMVNHMSQALGKPFRLLSVPLWCYRLVGKLTGKTDVVDRLLGSLQVDISHTKETLNWAPPQTLQQGFKETAEAFLKYNEKNK